MRRSIAPEFGLKTRTGMRFVAALPDSPRLAVFRDALLVVSPDAPPMILRDGRATLLVLDGGGRA